MWFRQINSVVRQKSLRIDLDKKLKSESKSKNIWTLAMPLTPMILIFVVRLSLSLSLSLREWRPFRGRQILAPSICIACWLLELSWNNSVEYGNKQITYLSCQLANNCGPQSIGRSRNISSVPLLGWRANAAIIICVWLCSIINYKAIS